MHTFFANGDFCGILLLVVVALAVGDRASRGSAKVRRYGACVAGLALVAQLYVAHTAGLLSGEDLAVVCLRAGLFSAIALGVSWMALALLGAIWEATLGALLRSLRSWGGTLRSRAQARRREHAEKARQREIAEAYRTAAPERERGVREAEMRARYAAEEQRRREEARAAIELYYDAHAPEIAELFSREQLGDYLTRHLGDDKEASRVEARAEQLRGMLVQLVHKVDPPRKALTVESLSEWYRETRARIDAQELEQRYKNVQLAHLHTRYVELMNDLMQEMEP